MEYPKLNAVGNKRQKARNSVLSLNVLKDAGTENKFYTILQLSQGIRSSYRDMY